MDRTPEKVQPPTHDVLALGVPSSLVFDDDSLSPILSGEPALPPSPASVTELWLRSLDRSDDCERAFVAVLVKNPELIKAPEELDDAEQCLRRALDHIVSKEGAGYAASLAALGRIVESKQQLGEAEMLYRQALVLQEQDLGLSHKDTLATGLRLVSLLDKTARQTEAQQLRNILQARDVSGDEEYWQQNRLRAIALDMFMAGQYVEAESIYRRLAEKRFQLCSTHCHLARVYLMLDLESEARREVEHACEYRDRSPAYAIVRMLFLKTLTQMLADSEWKPVLLELKQALTTPAAHMDWKMRPVLEHLQPRLGPPRYELMAAVVAAICESSKIPDLEANPLWQSACGVQKNAASPGLGADPVAAVPETSPPSNEAGIKPSAIEPDKFSFGKVVKVSGNTVTVKQPVFNHDTEIECEYRITERTEFGSESRLEDLKPGDNVVLDYVESQEQMLVVTLVKDTSAESCPPDVMPTPPRANNQPICTP